MEWSQRKKRPFFLYGASRLQFIVINRNLAASLQLSAVNLKAEVFLKSCGQLLYKQKFMCMRCSTNSCLPRGEGGDEGAG